MSTKEQSWNRRDFERARAVIADPVFLEWVRGHAKTEELIRLMAREFAAARAEGGQA